MPSLLKQQWCQAGAQYCPFSSPGWQNARQESLTMLCNGLFPGSAQMSERDQKTWMAGLSQVLA